MARWVRSFKLSYRAFAFTEGEEIRSKFRFAFACVVTSIPFAILEVVGVPRVVCLSLLFVSGIIVATIWIATEIAPHLSFDFYPEKRQEVLRLLLSMEEAITLLEGGLREIFGSLEETGHLPDIRGSVGERISRATQIAAEVKVKKGEILDWKALVAFIGSGSLTRWTTASNEIDRMVKLWQRAIPIIAAIEQKRGVGKVSHADSRRSALADALPILMDAEAMKVAIADLVAKERSAQAVREERRVAV
jgi:hypothetical protein